MKLYRILFPIFILTQMSTYALPKITSNIPDTLMANRYYSMADSLYTKAEYSESIKYYTIAADAYLAAKSWRKYVNCFNRISKNYWKWGKYDEALKKAEEALALSIEYMGDLNLEQALAYKHMGTIHNKTGSFKKAIKFQNKSLNIRKQLLPSDHVDISINLNAIAGNYFRLGSLNKASEYLLQSLRIRLRQVPIDSSLIASSLSNLGMINWNLGEYDSAIFYQQSSIKLKKKILPTDHPNLGKSYNGIGLAYLYKGFNHLAIEFFLQCQKIYESKLSKKHISIGHLYQNSALAYRNIGDYKKAIGYTRKALSIKKAVYTNSTGSEIASLYSNLGLIYFNSNMQDSAKHYFSKSLEASYDNNISISDSYNYLGLISQSKGELDESMQWYYKAKQFLASMFIDRHPLKVYTENNLAELELLRNNNIKAKKLFESAIAMNVHPTGINRSNNNVSIKCLDENELLRSYHGLARCQEKLYQKLGDLNYLLISLTNFQKCDSLITNLNNGHSNFQDKIDFLERVSSVYDGAVRITLKLAQVRGSIEYKQLAYQFSEKSKAGALSHALSNLSAKAFGQVPDSILQAEKTLKIDETFYKNQLQHELAKTTDTDEHKISKWRDRLFLTRRLTDSLLNFMERNYPKYHTLKYNRNINSVEEVQSKLDQNTALIEYFVGREHLYAFVISNTGFEIVFMPFDSTDHVMIQNLRSIIRQSGVAIGSRQDEFAELSFEMFNKYLNPALAKLDGKQENLIIIPDGELSYVPFEILLTEEISSNNLKYEQLPYLLKQFNVQYAYSASLLFGQDNYPGTTVSKSLIAFAPEYELTVNDSVATRQFGQFRDQVTSLKWNAPEVTFIENYIGGDLYTGVNAKEGIFKKEVSDYQIIHLAMHALVDDENPMYSKLVFTQGIDSLEDNLLHAYEIFNMELPAGMVVLSACETGYGQLTRGEGVMSLARAFSYAGCPSVVMSHWSVNDASTAKLMGYFYKHLSNGSRKDVALRQAKLEYLENADPAQANPYYWGSFVVMGDVSPLQFKSKLQYWWWAVSGMILIAMVFLYLNRNRYFNSKTAI